MLPLKYCIYYKIIKQTLHDALKKIIFNSYIFYICNLIPDALTQKYKKAVHIFLQALEQKLFERNLVARTIS